MKVQNTWKQKAILLADTGTLSWRKIANLLGVPKSSCSDYLRNYYEGKDEESEKKYYDGFSKEELVFAGVKKECVKGGVIGDIFKIATDPTKENGTHLFLPDAQVKKGVSLDFLHWQGHYIVRKLPDVLVCAGDFADMESCSGYNKGKISAEGKRVQEDINITIEGMKILLKPLYELQQEQLRTTGEISYKPRLVLTLGNHCDRITRYVSENPSLHGFLSIDSLRYKDFGWEVVDFLTPINIGGITYCHYFPNVMTGKPLAGTAANMLKTLSGSFTMGHRQTLDVATRFSQLDGSQQWGLICGASYEHEEDYKGKMGNRHFRGIVVKHNVKNGNYDPLFVSNTWLKAQYGDKI